MCFVSICAAPNAVTETGTLLISSARRRAVTTMSPLELSATLPFETSVGVVAPCAEAAAGPDTSWASAVLPHSSAPTQLDNVNATFAFIAASSRRGLLFLTSYEPCRPREPVESLRNVRHDGAKITLMVAANGFEHKRLTKVAAGGRQPAGRGPLPPVPSG